MLGAPVSLLNDTGQICFITKAIGLVIVDSRRNHIVEAEGTLLGRIVGRAALPFDTSTGGQDALELRDGNMSHSQSKPTGGYSIVHNRSTLIRLW